MQMHGVLDGLRPESVVVDIWPLYGRVHHHAPSALHDNLDSVLQDAIVMVAANSAQGDCLVFFPKAFSEKLLRYKCHCQCNIFEQ